MRSWPAAVASCGGNRYDRNANQTPGWKGNTIKIVRYIDGQGTTSYGTQHPDGSVTRIEGCVFGEYRDSGEVAEVKKLLAPVEASAVLCIGLNYRKHAEEGNAPIPEHPILFLKMPSNVQNPGDPILLPQRLASTEVDYECELAVVIGKECKNATRENALDHVLGYTCANDVSARDWQIKWGGSQWCRGKTFDTFCPLGPCLVTTDDISNPNTLGIKTILNGEVLQDWNTDDMIFDVPTLIEFLSSSTRLAPGTVILTGTPQGVGFARRPPIFLQHGDSITIEIEHIGQLTNPVENEEV